MLPPWCQSRPSSKMPRFLGSILGLTEPRFRNHCLLDSRVFRSEQKNTGEKKMGKGGGIGLVSGVEDVDFGGFLFQTKICGGLKPKIGRRWPSWLICIHVYIYTCFLFIYRIYIYVGVYLYIYTYIYWIHMGGSTTNETRFKRMAFWNGDFQPRYVKIWESSWLVNQPAPGHVLPSEIRPYDQGFWKTISCPFIRPAINAFFLKGGAWGGWFDQP